MKCTQPNVVSLSPHLTIERDDGKSYTILIDENREHMGEEVAKSALTHQSMIIGQDTRPYEEFYHFPHFFDIEEKQACVLSLYDLMTVDEESLQQYAQHQVAKDGSIHINIPDAAGFIKSLLALRFNQPVKIDTIALTPGGSTWMLK